MKWLEKIQQSENINQLPTFAELQEIAEDEGVDLQEEWSNGADIVIADGTNVQLEYGCNCFDNADEWYFYVAEDIYICAECGLMQIDHYDIKQQVGYEDIGNPKLLPLNWDRYRVKEFLKKKVNNANEYMANKEKRRNERQRMAMCRLCKHMGFWGCEHKLEEENLGELCDGYEEK